MSTKMNKGELQQIRILIADDHPVLRTGLRALINAESDMTVVDEAGDPAETLHKTKTFNPDVLILDLTMGRQNTLKELKRIHQQCPKTRVLILTMHEEPQYVHAALKAGASGYAVKGAADTELITAIRAVHRGRTFFDVDLGAHESGERLSETAEKTAEQQMKNILSPREQEVLQYVAQGYTSEQVADHLKLSRKSVESYRARLMEKLDLQNRAELVRFAREAGLFSDV